MKIIKSPLKLYANAKAVIVQFLYLPGKDRIKNVVKRLSAMNAGDTEICLKKVKKEFLIRHRNLEEIFSAHFNAIEQQFGKSLANFSAGKKLLLGAYFTKEYSIQAAALFNPSIVVHPDQKNLNTGELRFVMSLRATGEGHISSIVFQTGIVDSKGKLRLDDPPKYFTSLNKKTKGILDKVSISRPLSAIAGFDERVLESLPNTFTVEEGAEILKSIALKDPSLQNAVTSISDFIDLNYELESPPGIPINEMVIFPSSKAERMGMEDVRFVHFKTSEEDCYYGTYTAYDGNQIKTQLIETNNFSSFKIKSLAGPAISDKGMALFPEKINGQYVMISRQGGEKIYIMYSTDLCLWKKFDVLMEPKYDWELLQLGNCGSPVKTDKGWLLLTHGVGPMRKYVISAILLDLNDPSQVTGRLGKPMIEADENEREGYVPNVVYTCGCLLHGNHLIIPYAVSDAATCFATVLLDELLNEMIYQ